jgi:hypothetical protein
LIWALAEIARAFMLPVECLYVDHLDEDEL